MKTIDNFLNEGVHFDSESKVSIGLYQSITDLSAVLHEINSEDTPWEHAFVYADNITVDLPTENDTVGFDLSQQRQSVTLVVRSLTIEGNGAIFFLDRLGRSKQVNLFVQNYSGGSLQVSSGRSSSIDIPVGEINAKYTTQATISQSIFVPKSGAAPSEWSIDSPFYWLLNQTFQDAFALWGTNAALARQMFLWIASVTVNLSWGNDASLEMRSMGTQSAALAAKLSRPAHTNYVPKLSHKTYKADIETHAVVASNIEKNFNIFTDIHTTLAVQKKAAKTVIDKIATEQDYTNELIESANTRLRNAQTTLTDNINKFNSQKATSPAGPLAQAESALKTEIKKEKEKAEAEACFTAIQCAASLGAAVASFGAGVGGAVKAVEGIGELVKKINEIVEMIAKLKEFADAMTKIINLANSASTVPGEQVNLYSQTADVSLSSTDWDTLREQWDAQMDPYINSTKLGVSIANYRAQGRILIIYGQAVTESATALSKIQQEIIELKMRQKMYDAQKNPITTFIETEEVEKEQVQKIALLLQQRYLDQKRHILYEIENYRDAYRYWALPAVEPQSLQNLQKQFNSDVYEIICISADIQDAITNALNGFTSDQSSIRCHISQRLTSDQLSALKNGDPIEIPIVLEGGDFAGWERIRVSTVEVLFEGLEKVSSNLDDGGKVYHCHIENSGVYRDLLHHTSWTFVAESTLSKGYSAHVRPLTPDESSDTNSIVTDSDSPSSASLTTSDDPYYYPTLATTWKIKLPQDLSDNSTIDYSQVTSVKLILHGTAMEGLLRGCRRETQNLF